MARPRKQPPRAAQNLPYGQGQAMAEAQKIIPLPDNRNVPSAAPPPAAPSPAGPVSDGQNPLADPQAAAELAAAMMESPTGSLTDPTARPDEPITAGLPVGAGPGPAALSQVVMQKGSVTDFFSLAAQVFGNDPQLAEMAMRARKRGL